jgi:hypothetical protein
MKHPTLQALQDYFENVLDRNEEKIIQLHLLDCDLCTKVLADFTAIETRIKSVKPISVSQDLKSKIFKNIHVLIEEKRQRFEHKKMSSDSRKEQLDSLRDQLQEWKQNLYPELKIPALQICSLTIMLSTFIAVEKSSSRNEVEFKPLNDEVSIMTHDQLSVEEEK